MNYSSIIDAAWKSRLVPLFVDLLENTLENGLYVPLKRSPQQTLYTTPASIFDGSYALIYGGMTRFEAYVQSILDVDYHVIVQVGRVTNENNPVESAEQHVSDIEKILLTVMNLSTISQRGYIVQPMPNGKAVALATNASAMIYELNFLITVRLDANALLV